MVKCSTFGMRDGLSSGLGRESGTKRNGSARNSEFMREEEWAIS